MSFKLIGPDGIDMTHLAPNARYVSLKKMEGLAEAANCDLVVSFVSRPLQPPAQESGGSVDATAKGDGG